VLQRYDPEMVDTYGNVAAGAPAAKLTIGPDGSCSGLSCTSLIPGPHTVTARLGGFTATAQLMITPVAPLLSVQTRSLDIRRHRRSAGLRVACVAPAGETCLVAGTVTATFRKHQLKLGNVSARIRSGTGATLTLKLGKRVAALLRGHTVDAKAVLAVIDQSGHATVTARFRIKIR
jgi:hypothetical protein